MTVGSSGLWYAGECDIASGELKEAQKAGAELMQERDELSAQLAGLEQQLADVTQAHDELKFTACNFILLTAPLMLCYMKLMFILSCCH